MTPDAVPIIEASVKIRRFFSSATAELESVPEATTFLTPARHLATFSTYEPMEASTTRAQLASRQLAELEQTVVLQWIQGHTESWATSRLTGSSRWPTATKTHWTLRRGGAIYVSLAKTCTSFSFWSTLKPMRKHHPFPREVPYASF